MPLDSSVRATCDLSLSESGASFAAASPGVGDVSLLGVDVARRHRHRERRAVAIEDLASLRGQRDRSHALVEPEQLVAVVLPTWSTARRTTIATSAKRTRRAARSAGEDACGCSSASDDDRLQSLTAPIERVRFPGRSRRPGARHVEDVDVALGETHAMALGPGGDPAGGGQMGGLLA